MGSQEVLQETTARGLLTPEHESVFEPEDDRRCWSERKLSIGEDGGLLLRIWDYRSGSQPDQSGRLQARDSRRRLDTRESRIQTLTAHADHKTWTNTPYISFTSSPAALNEYAEYRRGRRGEQHLVVIDPQRRFDLGLPILNFHDEMVFYGIEDPYDRNYRYYMDHYLCVWEVTPTEIVGMWEWGELHDNERWYEDIVLPHVRAVQNERHRVEDSNAPPSDLEDSDSEDSDERVGEESVDGELSNMLDDLLKINMPTPASQCPI